MKAKAKTAAVVAAAVLGTAGAAWAVPIVSDVNMGQIANSRWVQVTYNLTGEDAIVTLSIETNGVAIPDSAVTRLSGDVRKVVTQGTGKSILWNAGVDWPEHVVANAKARVTAWSTDAPPQVLVIDLTGGKDAEFYPVEYYTSAEALPYGGLTNTIYKSAYLVMRKIDNGSFLMGEGTGILAVTLTKDFYAGVFQVTQGQWYNVMGTSPSYFNEATRRAIRPVEFVSYNDIRGTAALGGGDWPANNNVYALSFMGRLRSKTGLAELDLPTEAQWEYACRAGTSTYFNDGLATPANYETNAQMNVLGRYQYNGGRIWPTWAYPARGSDTDHGTAVVGSYQPNNWGLYDMHGNVWEWCLDWFNPVLLGGTDPRGAVGGTDRVVKGACWHFSAGWARSAFRLNFPPDAMSYKAGYGDAGFRLVRTLP